MRPHHTKNKGDLGVLHASVDLAEKGYQVLLPLSEHEAFDIVACKDGVFLRVQVKYRAAVRGTIPVSMRTTWVDAHGIHSVPIDKAAIEVMCIYCPDTRRCYYVDPACVRRNFALRLSPPRNNQRRRILFADDFLDIPSSVRGVPAGA